MFFLLHFGSVFNVWKIGFEEQAFAKLKIEQFEQKKYLHKVAFNPEAAGHGGISNACDEILTLFSQVSAMK